MNRYNMVVKSRWLTSSTHQEQTFLDDENLKVKDINNHPLLIWLNFSWTVSSAHVFFVCFKPCSCFILLQHVLVKLCPWIKCLWPCDWFSGVAALLVFQLPLVSSALHCNVTQQLDGSFMYQLSEPHASSCHISWEDVHVSPAHQWQSSTSSDTFWPSLSLLGTLETIISFNFWVWVHLLTWRRQGLGPTPVSHRGQIQILPSVFINSAVFILVSFSHNRSKSQSFRATLLIGLCVCFSENRHRPRLWKKWNSGAGSEQPVHHHEELLWLPALQERLFRGKEQL